MKKRIIAYFSLTKTAYNGILVMLLFIFLGFIISELYINLAAEPLQNVEKWTEDRPVSELRKVINPPKHSRKNTTKSVHFYEFNPNTADISTWMDFGLSQKQAQSILNYIAKGGKFRKKEDLKKMYVISNELYDRLFPFVMIHPNKNQPTLTEKIDVVKKNQVFLNLNIELNNADTSQLKKLKGIGSVLASRIVRFRNKLGGFYSINQIREVYGINDSLFNQIKNQLHVDEKLIQKVRINTANFDTLRRFSFLKYHQIHVLIAYRNEHGKFLSASDLEKIVILPREQIQKLEPYLRYD